MNLREAVVLTYAAVGQEMTDAALAMVIRDLESYPTKDVGTALSRCRRELRRISLADILERIPGCHPGPEEAWGIVARCLNDERVTVVWTDEIAQAFGAALGLQDDQIAARMAFKETYSRIVAESRDARKPIVWRASLGHDPAGREGPLLRAAELGRLPAAHVAKLLPHLAEPGSSLQKLLAGAIKQIEQRE